MWQAFLEESQTGQAFRYRIAAQGDALTYGEAIDLWAGSAGFRSFYSTLLAEIDVDAYFWELPPVTRKSLDQPFEFVLIASAQLARFNPDPAAFAEYFYLEPATPVLTFSNLGRDAVLVVPSPESPYATYGHLAAFVRGARPGQQHALWQSVAAAIRSSLQEQARWLSTAGLGVPWLHLRIDSRPKYYRYSRYRSRGGFSA